MLDYEEFRMSLWRLQEWHDNFRTLDADLSGIIHEPTPRRFARRVPPASRSSAAGRTRTFSTRFARPGPSSRISTPSIPTAPRPGAPPGASPNDGKMLTPRASPACATTSCRPASGTRTNANRWDPRMPRRFCEVRRRTVGAGQDLHEPRSPSSCTRTSSREYSPFSRRHTNPDITSRPRGLTSGMF